MGKTSLVGGTRLPKSDPTISTYGLVDELNSLIGLCCTQLKEFGQGYQGETISFLQEIQRNLFVLGSLLACEKKKRASLPQLEPTAIEQLEKEIDHLDSSLAPLKNFILPGGTIPSSYFHLARSICRRVEREVVALGPDKIPANALPLYQPPIRLPLCFSKGH